MTRLRTSLHGIIVRAVPRGLAPSRRSAQLPALLAIAVGASLLLSPASRSQNLDQSIAAAYVAFFNRAPDFSGITFWRNVANTSGLSDLALLRQLAEGFAQHPSFGETYGDLDDEAFVDAIYINIGGQPADAAGLLNWTGFLANGAERSTVVADLIYGLLNISQAVLDELVAQGDITPAEANAAAARSARLRNRAFIGTAFSGLLREASNLNPATDPLDPASLASDTAYLASVAIICTVSDAPPSVDPPLALLGTLPSPETVIDTFRTCTDEIVRQPVNDTGLVSGGNYPQGNNAICSGETIEQQDCAHGRDVTNNDDSDGHAGFSFTKLDASGNALPASASSWACVRDNVTALTWEVKTTDSSIHNGDLVYRWGGVGADPVGDVFFDDWNVLVNGSNAERLCGYDNWRVPRPKELEGIADLNLVLRKPAIDLGFFPNTQATGYWTSAAGAGSSGAWYVVFDYGYANGRQFRGSPFPVRLVRSD